MSNLRSVQDLLHNYFFFLMLNDPNRLTQSDGIKEEKKKQHTKHLICNLKEKETNISLYTAEKSNIHRKMTLSY